MSKSSPARSPAGDELSALVVHVLRLHGVLTAAGDELAASGGQTSARWWVMAAIERAPETVAGVARALGLARQSVQRVADLLVEDGLASYDDNPEHARAKLVRLTARGAAALRKIQTVQRTWADALGKKLGVTPLRELNARLANVLRSLSED